MATYSGRTEQPWKHPPAAGRECATAQSHEKKERKKSHRTLKHPPTALANTLLQTELKADIPNLTDFLFIFLSLFDIMAIGTGQVLVPHSKISAGSRVFQAVPGGVLQ